MIRRVQHGSRNVAARLDHLKQRRAARDPVVWRRFIHAAAMLLKGTGTLYSIAYGVEADLRRLPPSPLDRYLPWLFDQMKGWIPDRSEEWVRLRDWLLGTRPNLQGVTLQEAMDRAIQWHRGLEEKVGKRATDLHRRLPTVTYAFQQELFVRRGPRDFASQVSDFAEWTWRRGGTDQTWMAIGRELGHCYQKADVLNWYRHHGLELHALVDPKGRPHVVVAFTRGFGASSDEADQQAIDVMLEAGGIQIRGKRDVLPALRFLPAVLHLLASWGIKHHYPPEYGGDQAALAILDPQAMLEHSIEIQDRDYPDDAEEEEEGWGPPVAWAEALDKLGHAAFPNWFPPYVAVLLGFQTWLLQAQAEFGTRLAMESGGWIRTVQRDPKVPFQRLFQPDVSSPQAFTRSWEETAGWRRELNATGFRA